MSATQFRLVTRSDFDGLVCGVLLKEVNLIDEITFVHPKDMQDGKIAITDRDITTNLPYVEGCHLAFDHHLSESKRVGKKDNHIIDPDAVPGILFLNRPLTNNHANIIDLAPTILKSLNVPVPQSVEGKSLL